MTPSAGTPKKVGELFRVFTDLPASGKADPRQQKFGQVLGDMLLENAASEEPEELAITNMTGFPASCVDLGWLQLKIKEFALKNPMPVKTLAGIVEGELWDILQRAKRVRVRPERKARALNIDFMTKDDFGRYEYGFDVLVVPVADGDVT